MPPKVAWEYRAEPEQGSLEHQLLTDFLVKKNWLKGKQSKEGAVGE